MSIFKNYIYNLFYQIILIIVPVVTIPYVTGVFGASNIGIYSLSDSIIQCFILFGTFGQFMYASRQIAYVRDDFELKSKTFWEILCLKLGFTAIALIVYLIFITFSHFENKSIFFIQAINLLGMAFDVSWLFMGVEDFKKLALRGISIKISGVILIFTLIKTPLDLWKYALIIILINILSNLILWCYVPKLVKPVKIKLKGVISHIKPGIPLFLTSVQLS
ncbi:MAG: oligosaccharide flippase family protein [bacterium]